MTPGNWFRLVNSSLFCLLLFTSFTHVKNEGLTNDIFSYTNKFRQAKGLPSLIMREELNEIAQQHSVNMASGKVSFGHEGMNQRFAAAGRKLSGISNYAENVAFGAKSGEEVVTLWKKSPDHRKNMLGKFKYIGIGAAADSKGVLYYTQVFAD